MARNRRKPGKITLTPKQCGEMDRAELDRALQSGYRLPIGGGALESNINGLWVAKQTAKGVPATTMTKRLRWVGGDIGVARTDGTEPYSDSTLFGDTVDFVNQINGNGAPVAQGQSGAIAYLSWLAGGQEVVTGGGNTIHSIAITGAPTGGQSVVSFNGFTFTVPYNMTAVDFQTAMLAAVSSQGNSLPANSVVCGGGPLPTTPITVTFEGPLGNQPVPLTAWSHTDAFTAGTTPALTVTQTTAGSAFQHVATPSNVGGFYSSWVKSVGASVVYRGQFNDCRIASLRYEGSSASKVVKLTPSLLVLSPGVTLDTDPAQVDDGTKPFLYTEAAGTFTIDGEVYRGHSAFAIEVQYGLNEWYGDSVYPYDVTNNRATVTLQGVTILLDAQGLARYNEQIYGTATPAANTSPITTIPALGSYACTFTRTNPYTGGPSESVELSVPSVKWDPNLAIPANPAGGPVEFAMAGEFRKLSGSPAWQVTTNNFDPAYSA